MVGMIGLPKIVRSPKGIEVDLSGRYTARIDTNNISPGEGRFHIHVYKGEIEVAKLNGRGGYIVRHRGRILQKPSQLPKRIRRNLNKLVRHIQKNI